MTKMGDIVVSKGRGDSVSCMLLYINRQPQFEEPPLNSALMEETYVDPFPQLLQNLTDTCKGGGGAGHGVTLCTRAAASYQHVLRNICTFHQVHAFYVQTADDVD